MSGDGTAALAARVRGVEALRAGGRRQEAVARMELLVVESTRRLGADHATTLALRSDLASLWVEDVPDPERVRRAVDLVADCEEALGGDDPTTLDARERLASLMALNGRHEEALLLAEHAIADATRVLGPGDPRTLGARKNRAATLVVAGRPHDARDELETVLADMARSPGIHPAALLSARRLLALSYRAVGMRTEARAELEPLLADCERALGAGAPLTKEVRHLLGEARVYPGPYVAGSGASPRPWVFVADGLRPLPDRFGAARPLSEAPLPRVAGQPASVASTVDDESGPHPPPQVEAEVGEETSLFVDGPDVINRGPDTAHGALTPTDRRVVVLVLGPVEITGWARPAEREPQLAEILCFLVLHRDRPVRSAALRLALRPDLDDEIAEKTLRAYLSHLRRTLGRDVLPHATRDGYQVSEMVTSDWEWFRALSGDDASASELQEALRLVRGRPFAGVAEGSFKWVDAELVISVMETAVGDAARRLTGMTKTADPERALWAVRRGLLAAPYDFELWRLHVELAAARGPAALARARKEAEVVLGDDARSLW